MNIPQTAKKTHRLLGYETAAILYAHDNEQHVTAQKYFRKTLEEEGVKIVDVENLRQQGQRVFCPADEYRERKTGRGYCVQLLSRRGADFKK